MNKYQKALNDLFYEPWDMMTREEAKAILQELVDNETAKKHLNFSEEEVKDE